MVTTFVFSYSSYDYFYDVLFLLTKGNALLLTNVFTYLLGCLLSSFLFYLLTYLLIIHSNDINVVAAESRLINPIQDEGGWEGGCKKAPLPVLPL